MRNGRAMTLCYNKRGTDALLDLTPTPANSKRTCRAMRDQSIA